ncbi:cytochrome P450 [Streptomyces sp. NPDC005955]|uniref:cytochrome P450 n=1 Tax=Streptomyces sp. NPDC005955 TaxID=3364738 RepID=UPI0036A39D98
MTTTAGTTAGPTARTGAPPLPTAPGALPVLGHALPLARDPLGFLSRLPARGDLVRVRIGPRTLVVVCEPELTRQVLLNDRVFDKGGPLSERGREVLGNALLTCSHAEHRRQRRQCQPSFQPPRMSAYADSFTEAARTAVDDWHDGRELDVVPTMMALTVHTAVTTMFTTDAPAHAPLATGALTDDIATVVEGVLRRALTPAFLRHVPSPERHRYDRAQVRLRALLGGLVAARRTDADPPDDLLHALLSAGGPDGPDGTPRLTDTEAVDQLLTFLVAGVETTASALAWAWHLLARHPEVERRVHHELDDVLDGRLPAPADVPSLPTTANVLTETLRLYPPLWMMTREVTQDTVLGTFALPRGTVLGVSPYVIHRRPDVYPEPDRFDPDRWRDRRPDRAAYLPFGSGARKCIGDRFGVVQATLVLATIAARWRLVPSGGRPPRFSALSTLTPRGLRMRITDRATRPTPGRPG